jgi:hypothetical protein
MIRVRRDVLCVAGNEIQPRVGAVSGDGFRVRAGAPAASLDKTRAAWNQQKKEKIRRAHAASPQHELCHPFEPEFRVDFTTGRAKVCQAGPRSRETRAS